MRYLLFGVVTAMAVISSSLGIADAPQGALHLQSRLRRPVALVLAEDSHTLFVANHHSGSISLVDTNEQRVVKEYDVGKKLADLATDSGSRQLFAVDEAANELVLILREGLNLPIVQRLTVPGTPVSVRVAADGARCFVAALWSREVSVVDVKPSLRIVKSFTLPFAPRLQLLLNDGKKLVVADSFGGRLAVIDVEHGVVESVRRIPGHNIRGLALSRDGKELLIAQQTLNSLAQTTLDDVHWGNLLTNNLRILQVANLLTPKAELLKAARLHYLGDVGNAAGDPGQVVVSADGKVMVALAGVGAVAIGNEKDYRWQRETVGRRPTALVTGSKGKRAYVANHFSDSITVIDLDRGGKSNEISIGAQPELRAADRGEMLFYDARLAHDGWLSCNSCHTDGHTNGMLNDNLGDGSFGAPKRVLSLLGARDTAPYAWLGTMPDLETQIRKSVLTTMHGSSPTQRQVKDLAAFVRTLPPPPALPAKQDSAAVDRGREVFQGHACARCHTPPAYTSSKSYDIGFHDEVGNTHFNPPSLRGVGQGGPYFHDNRAVSLEEVVAKYRHQLNGELTRQERDDLIDFLRNL